MARERIETLEQLGWNDRLEAHLGSLDRSDLVPARITRQDRNRYQLLSPEGQFVGELTGSMVSKASASADLPAVGDWVLASVRRDEMAATIHDILPRRSSFSRKVAGKNTKQQIVAANIDTVFLVSGLDHDFNLRRIERYVTLAWDSGAIPVIVLNKADLADDLEAIITQVESVAIGIDVVSVSTIGQPGIEPLRPYLQPGKTAAFLGSSGVGKSSLVNAILEGQHLATTPVRLDDSRGRHTTTFRELFVAPGGAILIDTPGMRELQLWTDAEGVRNTFPEIEELSESCKFSDCAHETEPGCAVRSALDSGDLSESRYNSYLKLMKEVAYLDRRKSESSYQDRKHDKALGKLYKSILKETYKNKGRN